MVMEPIGTPRLWGICSPLMLETAKLDTLPLNATRELAEIVFVEIVFVEIVFVEMATAVVTVVERLIVEIELVVKVLMLPVRELNWKHPILLAVIVPVLRNNALKVSAAIKPVLIKFVLRKPVLIGSKDVLMMPPFAIVMPPFTLMVDAFRVEGVPPLGIYGDPFIEFTFKKFVLMLNELNAAARTVFVLRVLVDMAAAWILFAFVVVVFMVFVVILAAKTVFVLMVIVLMDAALMAFPT